MKRISKILLSAVVSLAVLCSVLCINVFAEGTYISFSKNSLSVGDTVTVTVTFSADEAIYGVQCAVNYDSSVLEYKSGAGSGGAGTVSIVESPQGDKKYSCSLTFSAKAAGSSAVSLADCVISTMGSSGATEKGIKGSSATLTVKDASLSANATLKSLTVSAGKLSPAFSAGRTSYKVSVGNDVTECAVYATAADSAAKVEISGTNTLKMGDNVRKITVTAPSGAQKTYTVTVNRGDTAASSSEEVTDGETAVASPLAVTVDNMPYTVASDISDVKLFNGFSAAELDYNGEKIQVARDNSGYYALYYLTSDESGTKAPYVFDTNENAFKKLSYITQGENSYIISALPEGKTLSDDYYATVFEISGVSVNCFASTEQGLTDFYYIYCFNGTAYGFYRYDSRESSIQRYPELNLVDSAADGATASVEDGAGIVARFKSLSTNARIIVLGLAVVILGALALLVLFILKLIDRKHLSDLVGGFDGAEDFDEITLDSFSLINDEPVSAMESEPDFEDGNENLEQSAEVADSKDGATEKTE